MSKIWSWFLDRVGLGPSESDQLDQVANQITKEVTLHKELAAKSVALSRSKQRELGEAVAKYKNLEQAAIEMKRQGNVEAVDILVVDLAETKTLIEQLTGELTDLNAAATTAVNQFHSEQSEAETLLRQHPRLKAVAQMNKELAAMQKEMKAIAGASTAKGAYKALASKIDTKTQEYRAMAQLESGDAGRKAVVQQALKQVEVQKILQGIEAKALGPVIDAEVTEVPVIDRAMEALSEDPLNRKILPLPPKSEPQAPEVVVEESNEE